MKDIQASTEGFPKIPVNKVGVRNIEMPITLYRPDNTPFMITATMSSYCDLVDSLKGINMSRIARTLLEVFSGYSGYATTLSAQAAHKLKEAHGTDNIYLKVKFKYPWFTRSPSTDLASPEMANVEIETKLVGNELKQFMTLEIVGMSLCPCSKEMSLLKNNLNEAEQTIYDGWKRNADSKWPAMSSLMNKVERAGFGAHNQKSVVRVTVELPPSEEKILFIEDLIKVVNSCYSSPTFSILKRPDEKYVTELSYMSAYIDDRKNLVEKEGYGPKFVEDIVRQLADKLNGMLDEKIKDYVIVVSNQESIHSQDIEAVAVLSAGRELK